MNRDELGRRLNKVYLTKQKEKHARDVYKAAEDALHSADAARSEAYMNARRAMQELEDLLSENTVDTADVLLDCELK